MDGVMSVIKVGGEVFKYDVRGPEQADAIVFSNSLGTTLSLWDAQADALSVEYRVLRYETRGHGGSVKSKGPYTFPQLGADVLNLADALGIERFSFCGISMGGVIGQWLGIYAADRLDKLVLCNTAARLGTTQGWLDRATLVRSQGMGPVVEGTPGRWFTSEFLAAHAQQAQQRFDALLQTDPEGYAASCEALAHADFRNDLAHVKARTLVVAGLRDPVTTPADADYMAQRIPGAARVNLNASHLSNLEASTAFTHALRQHLAG
jgi:3-oxoadipate enol-lactonase